MLAVTDPGAGEPANGAQVFARAVLGCLDEWFEVHTWVPEGVGGGARNREMPDDPSAVQEAASALPPISLIYNLGGTSFGCRVCEAASRRLPAVPLVNHFQLNLGCYGWHQDLDAQQLQAFTAEQARCAVRAVRNLFPSHSELALAVEMLGVAPTDCYVVPNPFVPDDGSKPPTSSAPFTFFAAGRFSDSVKGADLLYRAFADLLRVGAEARLEIASDSDRFTPLLRPLPRHAWTLHGWLPRRRLHERMRASDVVVVPSRYEPFGLVAIEALCMGTPVIAMRVGGLQEIVHHGVNGWLTPPHEGSRGLRQALEWALGMGREALADMGEQAAAATRREYSLARVAGLVRAHLDNSRLHTMYGAAEAPPTGTAGRLLRQPAA
jgi:glycosyltransferase involved in cell wall biosynthesis